MKITKTNYYTLEANQAYWSASFVKAMMKCPASALAELRGEYTRPSSTALLIGSFVDAAFVGKRSFDRFISEHPEIINSRTGEIKKDFQKAIDMINRAKSDDVFMSYMKGQKQAIKTGKIAGIPFKCKIDVYSKGNRIVDLKTARDMQPVYVPGQGKISFAEYYNYPLQMAIYQMLEGNKLPCFLAVITKEEPPDIAIIEIPQHVLDAEIEVLYEKLPFFDAMRQGIIEPERCEECAYCRQTKKLTGAINLDELTEI